MDEATQDAPPTLVVAIPTFKRPERLSDLLPLVGDHLTRAVAEGLVRDPAILVVDNDASESARPVVDAVYSGFPATYVVETTPGIPAVRNRALDESAGFRLLSFIDDDELPLDDWLGALVRTWSAHHEPTAVVGRVVSIFADDVDPWVTASGLFQRPQKPTGTPVDVAATGNLLLDLDRVRASGVRFDESIGLGGGSDTMFSSALRLTGARFVWCNESVAEDTVELERQTRSWALKRAYSHGTVSVMVPLRLARTAGARTKVRVVGYLGGIARVVYGAVRAAAGRLTRSVAVRARGERMVYRGTGMMAGSLGRTYAAYKRPTSTA